METSKKTIGDLFIVGTDTGVGKTVLSLLMMQFFFAKGYAPFYIKPVQTGCKDPYDVDSDAGFVYRYVEPLRHKDPADSVIYCFKNPKAPLFAARDEGKKIDLAVMAHAITQKSFLHNPLILEAAGGVLVPVAENALIVDMIKVIRCSTIIAARAGLGTINHTLLTIEALRRREIHPLGIVFIDACDKVTQPEMIAENKASIEEASGVKVAGVISRILDFSQPPQVCYEPLVALFGEI